jgi:acetylornithine deacetylase/succinyl-diaminopimelate desuccinylase-like protein
MARTALDSLGTLDEAKAMLAALVGIRSFPGEELAAQQWVADWLRAHGFAVEMPEAGPNRPNVIARIDNGEGPVFLLNGHTDTVLPVEGWTCDPWQGRWEGDLFTGLGALDMKSGVVANMLAFRALDRCRESWRGSVVFSAVVDEEAYSIGARAMIADGIRADYCVVTESCWDFPTVGSFGKILVQVDVTGKSAHASMPENGVNAAVELAKWVARYEEQPMGTHPRLTAVQSLLTFHAGPEQYVITTPGTARATINRHTVPGESAEQAIATYRALADSLQSPASFDFSIQPPFYPPWETAIDAPIAQALAAAWRTETGRDEIPWGYRGFGDMNLFSHDAGIPTVMIGPRGKGFHENDEWVDTTTIPGTARITIRMIEALMPPA